MKELLLALLYYYSLWFNINLCEMGEELETVYCPETSTTTTSILPDPEYCGEISMEEVSKLLEQYYHEENHIEFLWRFNFKLISLDSLQMFLDANIIPNLSYKDAVCADYCRIMQGRFSEWSPATAFGIIWIYWQEGDTIVSHAKNIMIDCEKNVWFVEPQGNRIDNEDEGIYFILMKAK